MKTVWEYIDCRILTSKGDIEIIRSANTDLKITAANIVFDPCPAGYHVPSYKAIKAIVGSSSITDDCYWFGVNGEKTICWPACGFRRSADGKLGNRGSQSAYVGYHGWSAYTVAVEQCAGDVYGPSTNDLFGKNS